MKIFGIIASVIIILFGMVYCGIGIYAAGKVVAPYPSTIDIPATDISTNYEDMTLTTFDNLTLKGWYFKGTNDRVVIFVSGIRNNRLNKDYKGVDLAKEYLSLGYSVILFDNRGHGESSQTNLTYGIKESKDVLSVVNFAESKGYTKNHIAILAGSFGAISTLVGLEDLKGVGAIVLDSATAHLSPVISHVLAVENGLPEFFHPSVYFFARVLYGVDIPTINPVEIVKRVPSQKLLLLLGEKDILIPKWQSDEILAAAAPGSKLIIFPDGAHIETYKMHPELYRVKVFPYLAEELGLVERKF